MHTELTAKQVLKEIYGLNGTATRLPGECDSNFHIQTEDQKEYLLKISNPHEEIAIIEMQNAVLNCLQQTTATLDLPQLIPTTKGQLIGSYADQHHVRLFTFVAGQLFANVPKHSVFLLESLGTQLGFLSRGLENFNYPAAQRYLKWDLQRAGWIRESMNYIADHNDQECVAHFLQIFENKTAAILPNLRQSVIHGDLNDYNIVVSAQEKLQVTGVIDFGDVVATATICELAIALTYAMLNKSQPLETAVLIIKNYHAIYPLEENEITVLFDLICIRLCMSVVTSAMRKQENPHDPYLTISEKPAWQLLKTFRHVDPGVVTEVFRSACQSECLSKEKIKNLRAQYTGKNLSLAYENPLQIVRGKGQYLYDETGREYLDCINNVAHVGHCHPKVVAAGQKQMAILNTNTRYLDANLVRYAERLIATFPAPLEVCFFVCSGSEANELALRLAQAHTQRNNFLVMDHAYHGNTSTLINISPYKFNGRGGKGKPDFVEVLPIPNAQEPFSDLSINTNIAAFIAEPLLSCGGQIILPKGYLQHVYNAVRAKGGVCIADEIQVGLGRVGTHFWGFQTQDVIPDIVTLGKPLGNGYPMAAVITTREIANSFNNGMEYFNSFGGNSVACATGLAVLDVIEEENLQSHALEVGDYLKQQLSHLMKKYSCIKEVRGLGLFLGIEFHEKQNLAKALVNHMQERGILLSPDGPLQNVIKIKPPLVFTKANGDTLVSNLDSLLHPMSHNVHQSY